jgi:hypothetical protein
MGGLSVGCRDDHSALESSLCSRAIAFDSGDDSAPSFTDAKGARFVSRHFSNAQSRLCLDELRIKKHFLGDELHVDGAALFATLDQQAA